MSKVYAEGLAEPLTEPFAEEMPNTPHLSPCILHLRATVRLGLWLFVVETLILNIISQRARPMMIENSEEQA